MITGPLGFYTVAEALRSAAEADLAASAGGPVNRSCVVPGNIVWDGCDCGQLAVAVMRTYWSDNFPTEQIADMIGTGNCGPAWRVMDTAVNVVRCVPTADSTGMPSCEALDAAAQVGISDAAVVMSSVGRTLCDMKDKLKIVEYLVREQNFFTEGGCGGSDLRLVVALPRE